MAEGGTYLAAIQLLELRILRLFGKELLAPPGEPEAQAGSQAIPITVDVGSVGEAGDLIAGEQIQQFLQPGFALGDSALFLEKAQGLAGAARAEAGGFLGLLGLGRVLVNEGEPQVYARSFIR